MNRLRAFLFIGIGLSVYLGSSLAAETSDSGQADQDVVRAAYAKLVIATQLSALREAYTSGANLGRLKVTLSAIKTGPVSEIASELLGDLVAKPSGRTLSVSPVDWTYTTSTGKALRGEGATAVWIDSGYLSEDWDVPVGRLFADGVLDPGFTEYASFTVTLSYLGEKRQYPALFLFGKDISGRPMTLALDHIVGTSALQTLIQAPSTPDPLLADRFRDRPATRAFLESLQASGSCAAESRTQMCCDHDSGKCGVSVETLRQHGFSVSQSMSYNDVGKASPDCVFNCSLYNSTGALDPKSNLDQTLHVTGEHEGSVQFQSHCTYSGSSAPCVGLCSVSVITPAASDTGVTKTFCHVTAKGVNGSDGEGANNTCTGAFAYTAVTCAFCTCGPTVSVGIPTESGASVGITVGGSGTEIYKWGWGLVSGPCKNVGS